MKAKAALIMVDVQNDFCPGGALNVPRGDEVVGVLNRYSERFRALGLPIIATRDWHPAKTSHFKSYGGVWPEHCVQHTHGAAFRADLQLSGGEIVLSKGMEADEDSYSAFHGKDETGTPLAPLLRRLGVEQIFVGGLATDYCVKETALDGMKQGFQVAVLGDASRGVNLRPDDSQRALTEMRAAGVKILASLDELTI